MVYFPSSCWMSVDTHLLYIVHGPVMAALLVRILFAINSLIIILEMLLTCTEQNFLYFKCFGQNSEVARGFLYSVLQGQVLNIFQKQVL